MSAERQPSLEGTITGGILAPNNYLRDSGPTLAIGVRASVRVRRAIQASELESAITFTEVKIKRGWIAIGPRHRCLLNRSILALKTDGA